jgi:hypothetical protein
VSLMLHRVSAQDNNVSCLLAHLHQSSPSSSRRAARDNLRFITSVDHMAGTPGDWKMAQFVKDKLESYGVEARIEPVKTLLSYPSRHTRPELQLIQEGAGVVYRASLAEKVLPEDATSNSSWLRDHPYNG